MARAGQDREGYTAGRGGAILKDIRLGIPSWVPETEVVTTDIPPQLEEWGSFREEILKRLDKEENFFWGLCAPEAIYLMGNSEDIDIWCGVLNHEYMHEVLYDSDVPWEQHHNALGVLGEVGLGQFEKDYKEWRNRYG